MHPAADRSAMLGRIDAISHKPTYRHHPHRLNFGHACATITASREVAGAKREPQAGSDDSFVSLGQSWLIALHDHIVISRTGHASFKERGLL